MRAADVVYSLARLLSPESKRPEWLKPMVVGSEERYQNPAAPLGITADGPYTVTIQLNAPFAPFIQHLCTVNCAVVPREAVELRSAYIAAGVVSPKCQTDALHVATATVSGCAMIVSWNFQHIVNYRRIPMYSAVNALNGYGPIAIHSPMEVVADERDRQEQEDV